MIKTKISCMIAEDYESINVDTEVVGLASKEGLITGLSDLLIKLYDQTKLEIITGAVEQFMDYLECEKKGE